VRFIGIVNIQRVAKTAVVAVCGFAALCSHDIAFNVVGSSVVTCNGTASVLWLPPCRFMFVKH